MDPGLRLLRLFISLIPDIIQVKFLSDQINEFEGEMINSENERSISKSQKTCNNSSQNLNNDISEVMFV